MGCLCVMSMHKFHVTEPMNPSEDDSLFNPSAVVLADVPVKSPRILFIYIINTNVYGIEVSQKYITWL